MAAPKTMLDLRDKRARFRSERSAIQKRPDKPAPLRVRKKRARLMWATIIVLGSALTALSITLLSHSSRFTISAVVVEGAHDIQPQAVQEYVLKMIDDSKWQYLSQKNIFTFDQGAIARGLASDMPRIRSVKLSRPSKFSQTLQVSIEERQPTALWCADSGACYQMDDSGFIFAESSTIAVTSYSFDGGVATSSSPIGQTFAGGHMSEILALLERLRQSGYTASGVTVDSKTDFRTHLTKGYDLKISFGTDPNALSRDLLLVLSSDALRGQEANLSYIDLRFGNRVYFKMKGEIAAKAGSG